MKEQFQDLGIPFVITSAEEHEGFTTLRRYDGQTFAFFAANDDILRGDTGDKGMSTYEDYVSNGGKLSTEAWLESLYYPKGPKGEHGEQGDTGPQGIPGDNFKLVRGYVTFTRTGRPSAYLTKSSGNNYILDVKIPTTNDIPVRMGTVHTLDSSLDPTGTLEKDYDNAIINLSIPQGPSSVIEVLPTEDDYPDINFFVNMQPYDAPLSVTDDIQEKVWNITFNIPSGIKGDQGDQGPTGYKTGQDVTYNKIIDSEGVINAPGKGSFLPVKFKKDSVLFFGWSCRTQKSIFQTAFGTDGTLISRTKSNGFVFGTISEGWQVIAKC